MRFAWTSPNRKKDPTVADPARLAKLLCDDFYGRHLDFSERRVPIRDAWSGLPEVEAVNELGRVSGRMVRLFLTFVSAMDRMRDSAQLWRAGSEFFRTNPEAFEPTRVCSMSYATLRQLLFDSRVSKLHKDDTQGWRTIASTLASGNGPVREVVDSGHGDAKELIADVRSRDPQGRPRFPLLGGDKIHLMWLRMMAEPGKARIRRLDAIPVAVDVHVRRVTENLGVTSIRGSDLNSTIKNEIQQAWSDAVAAARIGGPERIAGTCAALDPALWFYGKHGCSHCERVERQVRFGRACDSCRLPVSEPTGRRGTALLRLVRHLLRW